MGVPQLGMRGLRLVPNHFTVERGGTLVAENAVIPSKDVMESRRGQPKQQAWGTSSARVRAFHMFQNVLLGWRDTDNKLAYDTSGGTGTPTDLSGTYAPPSPSTTRMKFADMAKSMYFTTSAAPYALDAYNGTPRATGIPRPKDFLVQDVTSSSPGTTTLAGNPNVGWMSTNTAVGYRAVIGLRDANGVIRLSQPSGRIIIQNPADLPATLIVPGTMSRSGGNTVTVFSPSGFRAGDTFTLSPGEGNFAAGTKTVASVSVSQFTYTEAGANVANTVGQNISSGTKNVQVVVVLPAGVTAGAHFVQIYRTLMAPGAGSDPGDEMRQVFERFVTAADISSGATTIQDTCPESQFRGANLVTNPISGDGPLAINARPPIANDIAVWDNRMWFAQTTDRQRLTFRILGIGSPSGLQTNDIICIGTRSLIANVSGLTLVTAWNPSQNISMTLANIIFSMNLAGAVAPTQTCRALDDGSVYPPSILAEEDGIGGSRFYAACSRSSAVAERLPKATLVTNGASTNRASNVVTVTAPAHGFTSGDSVMLACSLTTDANFPPGLKGPITVTGANTFTFAETGANANLVDAFYATYAAVFGSDNNRLPLRYSKQLEPESCPLVNYPLGLPDNSTVLRIAPLGDKLYVFLQNSDIYRVSGTWPYQVKKFDGTAQLLAADSLVEHAGRLYALTTQGVVAISDGGVEVLSYDVEPGLDPLEGAALSTLITQAFAVSYESERQYQLWLPGQAGDTVCKQAYVFNSLVKDWTHWTQQTAGGLLNPVTGKLVLGAGDENTVRVENKAYTRSDFVDDSNSINVTGGAGPQIFTDGSGTYSRIQAGDYVDGTSLGLGFGRVATPFPGNKLIMVSTAFAQAVIAAAPVTLPVYRPISNTVSMVPDFAGAPEIEKQFREGKFHFSFFDVQTPAAGYTTEKQTASIAASPTTGSWPSYNGTLQASALPPVVLRVDVPEECERAVLLYPSITISEPKALWRLCGVTSTSEIISERTGT